MYRGRSLDTLLFERVSNIAKPSRVAGSAPIADELEDYVNTTLILKFPDGIYMFLGNEKEFEEFIKKYFGIFEYRTHKTLSIGGDKIVILKNDMGDYIFVPYQSFDELSFRVDYGDAQQEIVMPIPNVAFNLLYILGRDVEALDMLPLLCFQDGLYRRVFITENALEFFRNLIMESYRVPTYIT